MTKRSTGPVRRVTADEEDGDWLGAVYTSGDMDCRVSTPWPRTKTHIGPCKAGWVHKKWIALIAG